MPFWHIRFTVMTKWHICSANPAGLFERLPNMQKEARIHVGFRDRSSGERIPKSSEVAAIYNPIVFLGGAFQPLLNPGGLRTRRVGA